MVMLHKLSQLNEFGLTDLKVLPISDLAGNNFMIVEIAGATPKDLENLLSKQGKFEAKIGNETVMFRHDKKFVNPTCIAVKLESSDENFDEKFDKILNYSVERVGEDLKISAIALFDTNENFEEKGGADAVQYPHIFR